MILRVMKSLGSTAGGAGESALEVASLEQQLMNTEAYQGVDVMSESQMQHDIQYLL